MEMRLAENRPDMEKVISYIKQAGELFTDRTMAGKILQKGSTDFVTMVDTQVQEYLQGNASAALAPYPVYGGGKGQLGDQF